MCTQSGISNTSEKSDEKTPLSVYSEEEINSENSSPSPGNHSHPQLLPHLNTIKILSPNVSDSHIKDENGLCGHEDLLQIAPTDLKIETREFSARSREKEVERLQEKLASKSFWDGFGTSATTKKWSADVRHKSFFYNS